MPLVERPFRAVTFFSYFFPVRVGLDSIFNWGVFVNEFVEQAGDHSRRIAVGRYCRIAGIGKHRW